MRSAVVMLNLGKKEMDHGLTYLAVSRATQFKNIGIRGGVTVRKKIRLVFNIKHYEKKIYIF